MVIVAPHICFSFHTASTWCALSTPLHRLVSLSDNGESLALSLRLRDVAVRVAGKGRSTVDRSRVHRSSVGQTRGGVGETRSVAQSRRRLVVRRRRSVESSLFALRRSVDVCRRSGSLGSDKQGSEDGLVELHSALSLGVEEVPKDNQLQSVVLGWALVQALKGCRPLTNSPLEDTRCETFESLDETQSDEISQERSSSSFILLAWGFVIENAQREETRRDKREEGGSRESQAKDVEGDQQDVAIRQPRAHGSN